MRTVIPTTPRGPATELPEAHQEDAISEAQAHGREGQVHTLDMNLQPRDDFRKGTYAKGWADVSASLQFEEAAKAAMLTMQMTVLAIPMDAEVARDNAHLMKGAQMFLKEMMSLADSEPQPKTPITGINYRA